MKEPFFEPFLRRMRVRRILPYVRAFHGCRLLDVGCGWDAALLRAVEPFVARGVGVDFKAPDLATEKLSTRQVRLSDTLPFGDAEFDVVTMLAVLEHLDQPERVVAEIRRVLAPTGVFLLTVPSHAAKPVLEFLAFRLGLVNAEEMRDHKRYYGRSDLRDLLTSCGMVLAEHRYFQLGMNNFGVARKA